MLLRFALRQSGYWPHGWGLGRNEGATAEVLAGMRARVDELYAAHSSKITIIGWSLGGVYARMLARDRPDKVRRVITLGSPYRMVEADEFHPFRRARWDEFVQAHAPELTLLQEHEHHRPPLQMPATSIYSRTDAFAPWTLCLDETCPDAANRQAENVEVYSSHLGLATHPAVLAVVLDRLGQPSDQWRPFQARRSLSLFFPPPATWTHPKGAMVRPARPPRRRRTGVWAG